MAKSGMIAVPVGYDGFVNRLPWINIEITLFAIKPFVCKRNKIAYAGKD